MLNIDEYLLVCLSEECSECAKEADKTLRFGPECYDPNDPEKKFNVDRLIDEYYHIRAVMELLDSEGFLTLPDEEEARKKVSEKQIKVNDYRRVSIELGRSLRNGREEETEQVNLYRE